MENFDKYRKLLVNGLFSSHHAQEEAKKENITLDLIRQTINEGIAKFDSSKQNDKTHAWNYERHISFFLEKENLTVICCKSAENGILVISAYHGKSHCYYSNPYNRRF
jgi:hypothetical protein